MRIDLSLVYTLLGEIFDQDGFREELCLSDQTLLLLLIRNLEWLFRCRILLQPKLYRVVPEVIGVQAEVTISLDDVLFRDRFIVDMRDLYHVVIQGLVAYNVFLTQREHLSHLLENDTIVGAFYILQSIPRCLFWPFRWLCFTTGRVFGGCAGRRIFPLCQVGGSLEQPLLFC